VTTLRKAYSVFGAFLMLQFLLQLYFIAGAIFTIVNANDNAKDVYAAFKNADRFASLHVANGYLIGFVILIMVALSFASRYPWRTTIMTAVLWVLVAVQSVLAHTPLAALAALHGINALLIIGLGGYLTGTNWAFGRRASVTAEGTEVSLTT
jgi:Family of unknown function (DUF6220)